MPIIPAQDQDRLMDAQEFNRRVKAWGDKVRAESHGALTSMTKVYSGRLRSRLKDIVSLGKDDGVAQWVGFRFERYGVFVSYGVGRGWIRQGDTVVRAQRVRKGSEMYTHLRSKGYSKKELAEYSIPIKKDGKGRVPKDWLDPMIDRHINELADIAGEYYGDESLRHVLEEFDRMRIVKKH